MSILIIKQGVVYGAWAEGVRNQVTGLDRCHPRGTSAGTVSPTVSSVASEKSGLDDGPSQSQPWPQKLHALGRMLASGLTPSVYTSPLLPLFLLTCANGLHTWKHCF